MIPDVLRRKTHHARDFYHTERLSTSEVLGSSHALSVGYQSYRRVRPRGIIGKATPRSDSFREIVPCKVGELSNEIQRLLRV